MEMKKIEEYEGAIIFMLKECGLFVSGFVSGKYETIEQIKKAIDTEMNKINGIIEPNN